jgi:autotransporter-associated beta strand protein
LGTGPMTMGGSGTTGTLLYGGSGTIAKNITMAAGGVGAFDFSSAMTLSGIISGGGGLTKAGAGTLTLSNAGNAWLGTTTVSAGTLSISTAYLEDAADVSVATGAVLDLNFAGTDTIGSLYIGGVLQSAPGTYGSLASAADNKSADFTGNGLLEITLDGTATIFLFK